GAEKVRWSPVKRAPIDSQPQIALALRREAPNRRAVKCQVVPALDQEFLVVVQHVQAAFQITEKHRNRFDSLLIRQILDSFLLELLHRNAALPLFFGFQIQFFQFTIWNLEKAAKFVGHVSPSSLKMNFSVIKIAQPGQKSRIATIRYRGSARASNRKK